MVAMTMEPAHLEQGYPKRYVPTRLPQQHVARDFTLHHFSYEMYEHSYICCVLVSSNEFTMCNRIRDMSQRCATGIGRGQI